MTEITTTVTSAGASMGSIVISTDAGGVTLAGTDGIIRISDETGKVSVSEISGSVIIDQNSAGQIAVDLSASDGAVSIEAFAVGPQGERGPQGPAGSNGSVVYEQTSPSASWVVPNPFGRIPSVEVFLSTGESVLTDVEASGSFVNVVFAQAQTGWVVLS